MDDGEVAVDKKKKKKELLLKNLDGSRDREREKERERGIEQGKRIEKVFFFFYRLIDSLPY